MRHTKLIPVLSSIVFFSALAAFVPVSKMETNPTNNDYKITKTNSKLSRTKIDHEFGSETENPEGLRVSAVSSTKTNMGQSFSFQFATGGQGFCDTTDTYLIAPDDDSFEAYYNEFSKKTLEERKEIEKQYEEGLYETVEFDSYIYSITGKVSYPDIVIPRGLKRSVFFTLNINGIGSKAISEWENVNSITIPEEVGYILSDSFINVPAEMVFNVEYEEGEIPSTWANDWAHGAKVNYGCTIDKKKEYPASKAGAAKYGDDTKNFILGWSPAEGDKYPLTLEYKTTKNGELSETKYMEFPVSSKSSFFDAVGKEIYDYSVELNCDVRLESDEEIDFDSIRLHNVFPAIKGTNYSKEPDFTTPCVIIPSKLYTHVYSVDEFIEYNFTKLSSFSGYTAIDLDMKIADHEIYSLLKPNYYKTNKANLDSGKYYLRTRVTSLTQCSFQITFDNGENLETKLVNISTPVTQFILNNDGYSKLAFLIKNTDISENKDFDVSDIKALSFASFYVTLDIFGEKGPIARSNVTTRFGYLSIMPFTENAKVLNCSMLVLFLTVGYILLFAGATTALYFYLSNKYKNDEFRRMKPKSFIKNALLALGGSTVVLLLILFLILRSTVFNNAIVVFNPIDAYIIICGVLSVIIIGYFIKYLVVAAKRSKERKKIIKLHLNDQKVDDGTN